MLTITDDEEIEIKTPEGRVIKVTVAKRHKNKTKLGFSAELAITIQRIENEKPTETAQQNLNLEQVGNR